MIPKIFKNMSLFADGFGYAGLATELTPPVLTMKMEEYRGGGMDAPVSIPMGMEALTASFTVAEYNSALFAQFGLSDGNSTSLTFRAAQQADGEAEGVLISMSGTLRQIDGGSWKPGDMTSIKFEMPIRTYKLQIGATTVIDIDVPNMIRKINGVDQLASQRKALGL